MNISELIGMGQQAVKESYHATEWGKSYYSGEKYWDWLALAIRFVESNFPRDPDTIRFRKITLEANGNADSKFHPLISILRVFEQNPPVTY